MRWGAWVGCGGLRRLGLGDQRDQSSFQLIGAKADRGVLPRARIVGAGGAHSGTLDEELNVQRGVFFVMCTPYSASERLQNSPWLASTSEMHEGTKYEILRGKAPGAVGGVDVGLECPRAARAGQQHELVALPLASAPARPLTRSCGQDGARWSIGPRNRRINVSASRNDIH